ncbi:hypothetical protein GGF42_007981 [Coemansia sp. RSA 2424]|nr:hypothetical protein GGF42_007981 [Coemansia sp. RSA 2424]
MFNTCEYSDWGCKCAAQRTIASCFNNCPDDGGRAAQEGQVTVYCNAAMRVQEEKSIAASVSQKIQEVAKKSTTVPAAGKAVPSDVESGARSGGTMNGSAVPSTVHVALDATQSLGKVDRANQGSAAIAMDNSAALLRGVNGPAGVFAALLVGMVVMIG